MGMQGSDVQERSIASIHAWFCIDIPAIAKINSSVHVVVTVVLTQLEGVSRKLLRKICVDKLGMTLLAKYNSCGELVGRVVDRHTGKICQNLSCGEVSLQMIKHGLRCDNIVNAILSNLIPHVLRSRLIPRKTKLLVMDA